MAAVALPHGTSFLSKDTIVFPRSILDDLSVLKGSGNGSKRGQPRLNCCFIEAALHVLFSDPFVRHLAHRYGRVAKRDSITSDTERGSLILAVLELRWLLSTDGDTTQRDWDAAHDDIHRDIRAALRRADPTSEDENQMGDASAVAVMFLEWIHAFVLQQYRAVGACDRFLAAFLSYAHRVVRRRSTLCANCRTRTAVFAQAHSFDAATGSSDIGLLDGSALGVLEAISIDQAVGNDLEAIVNAQLTTRWEVLLNTCASCGRKSCIGHFALVNLPWMLYVAFNGRGGVSKPRELHYDPELMVVGPTIDGQYAKYRLVSRAHFRSSHYTVDVRTEWSEPEFKNWSFDKAVDTRGDTMHADTTCTLYLWQRVE
jgi:hypothetical protein